MLTNAGDVCGMWCEEKALPVLSVCMTCARAMEAADPGSAGDAQCQQRRKDAEDKFSNISDWTIKKVDSYFVSYSSDGHKADEIVVIAVKDKADVDETNATASIQNISRTFEQTQVVPETDALFFAKVAQAAQKEEGYHGATATATYTKAKVFGMLKDILAKGKLRRYKANGTLMMYVSSAIMDALEQSTEFTRKIEMTQVAEGGMGIETRVTDIDGVPIMEVVDDERFYDAFDWEPENGGFAPLKKGDRGYRKPCSCCNRSAQDQCFGSVRSDLQDRSEDLQHLLL